MNNRDWSSVWLMAALVFSVIGLVAAFFGLNMGPQILICIAAYSIHRRLDKQE